MFYRKIVALRCAMRGMHYEFRCWRKVTCVAFRVVLVRAILNSRWRASANKTAKSEEFRKQQIVLRRRAGMRNLKSVFDEDAATRTHLPEF